MVFSDNYNATLTHLMVLPVLILIHWGMGRFCFPFLASLALIRNVFKADILAEVKLLLKTLKIYKLCTSGTGTDI